MNKFKFFNRTGTIYREDHSAYGWFYLLRSLGLIEKEGYKGEALPEDFFEGDDLKAFNQKTITVRAVDEGWVHSSHGQAKIDLNTGDVLTANLDGETDPFSEVARFHLAEYKDCYGELDEQFDILDLGYFKTDGSYVPADEEFRKNVATQTK